MFKHQKKLLHPVKVKKPNPTYAALLQEQLGGPQGEMKAAMQYFAQSLRIQDKEIKDLFLDIAAEQRAKVVYQYLYRQIEDEGVREVIDFLLNREEAHNTMFRQAFNRIVDSGSQKDWGVTSDSRIYFDLSGDGQHFDPARKNPPEFKE